MTEAEAFKRQRDEATERAEAAEKRIEALETEGEQLIGEVASLKRRAEAAEKERDAALAAYEAMRGGLREHGFHLDGCKFKERQRDYNKGISHSPDEDECDCGLYALLASESPGREWLREWGVKVAHHAWRLGFFRGREYEEMDTLEAMRRADEFSLTNEAAAALVESLLPEGGK